MDRGLLVKLELLLLPPVGDAGTSRRGIHRSSASRFLSSRLETQAPPGSCYELHSHGRVTRRRWVRVMSGMPHTLPRENFSLPRSFSFLLLPLSLSLSLFLSHSFLCLSGKARNVTELRPFWRPSLRSTSLNRYATSTLKAIRFALNRIAANQRTRNALFSRLLATESKSSRLSSIYRCSFRYTMVFQRIRITQTTCQFFTIYQFPFFFFSNIFYCEFCI